MLNEWAALTGNRPEVLEATLQGYEGQAYREQDRRP